MAASARPRGGRATSAGAASNDVWAVGDQAQGNSVLPLIEHWDGTSWSIVATPSSVSFIAGMAASSGGTVLAVGQGTNQSAIILSN